jgi:diaminopimelate epimerase
MKALEFTKMHGLGNDFIVLDDLRPETATDERLKSLLSQKTFIQKICDRRFGIGADQILWLRKPHEPGAPGTGRRDVRMEILNADGSAAEMCGNGIRAVALYLNRHVFKNQTELRIETLAGVKTVSIEGDHVRVDMGVPKLGLGVANGGELISVDDQEFRFLEVNVGNPHAVIFTEKLSAVPVEKWGPQIECHSRFPARTNVEFVKVESPHELRVRVWERGAGITLACGTGACASAVAGLASRRLQNPVEVKLPGGSLKITWNGASTPVMMTGPATEVYRGSFSVINL